MRQLYIIFQLGLTLFPSVKIQPLNAQEIHYRHLMQQVVQASQSVNSYTNHTTLALKMTHEGKAINKKQDLYLEVCYHSKDKIKQANSQLEIELNGQVHYHQAILSNQTPWLYQQRWDSNIPLTSNEFVEVQPNYRKLVLNLSKLSAHHISISQESSHYLVRLSGIDLNSERGLLQELNIEPLQSQLKKGQIHLTLAIDKNSWGISKIRMSVQPPTTMIDQEVFSMDLYLSFYLINQTRIENRLLD